MCKKLRDILFPTNILGKDVQCVVYPLSRTQFPINCNVTWTGKFFRAQWTTKKMNGRITKNRLNVKNGQTVIVPVTPMHGDRAASDLYFKCTDVTSLIVNGQQLI